MPTFLRRDAVRFSKFGKGRGKKAKWRSPKGRDNKMREKRRGYPIVVSIGYSTDKKEKGNIKALVPLTVRNLSDLEKATTKNIIIIGNIGKKKKIEILEKAKALKLTVDKTNVDRALDKLKGAKKDEPK